MRALIVSNMAPDRAHPERGSFVRDQVAALRAIDGLEVELCEVSPGGRSLIAGWPALRRRHGAGAFDVVHAHFSLSALPAFAVRAATRGMTVHGTDVRHPRTRQITRALLPLMDLVVAVSAQLAGELPGAAARRRAVVIPCGVQTSRFQPIPRAQARAELGLAPDEPHLLFPADPARPAKRYALARALADAAGVPLISLGGVAPERVPLFVNAANAVLVPSSREGFGLAVLEALACDVPVLACPVGIHPEALDGISGTLCAPFQARVWLDALRPHLAAPDPRIEGRDRAQAFGVQRMAQKLASAWRDAMR